MKTIYENQKLVIKETPGCLWIFGLFFAIGGATFVYGSLGGYSNYEKITPLVAAVHFTLGAAAFAVGYWVLFKSPVTHITIDRDSETVTYKTRGLAGRKLQTFRFADVKAFDVIEETDSEGSPIFSLALQPITGELIRISALQSHFESDKRDIAFAANEFMYKQLPSVTDDLDA